MSIKRILTSAAIALLPIAAGAATFVVPAAGTGAGANNSQWQSELTLHSTSSSAMTVHMVFHDQNGPAENTAVQLAPRSTVSIADIVKTRFGREAATGAIELIVDDAFATKLAITSRTFNTSENGEFGQDIPAFNLTDSATVGDTVVLAAPANAADNRFNAGLYAATPSTVRWDLLRADGTLVKSVSIDYGTGTQKQYGLAVQSIFGETPADNDVIQAVVTRGAVIVYGSAINNRTGDPTYVPGVATTTDTRVQFIGVDANLDDVAEILDANHDGVLDAPVSIHSSSPWPNSFRILVAGSDARFELVTPNEDITVSPDGYVIWKPGTASKSVQSIKVRVTAGGVTDVVTIPVTFL